MSDETKPTAPEPESGDAQAANNQAEPTLDDLLAEFDSQAASEPASEPAVEPKLSAADLQSALREVQQFQSERQQERVSKDISQAVEAVRGELDPEADELVRGWLDVQAQNDARFRTAWQSRHTDPAKWNRVLKGMSDQFAAKYGKRFGRADQDDREAMAAAVRVAGRHSQPTTHSDAPNLAAMSDHEFAMFKARLR